MDADARRALEVIRRGNTESIREAIDSLLGFKLSERIQAAREDLPTNCRQEYCRRGRREGYGSLICRECDSLDAQRDRLDEIINKLDNLEIVESPTEEEKERSRLLVEKILADNAAARALREQSQFPVSGERKR